jgi:hypothetical protein
LVFHLSLIQAKLQTKVKKTQALHPNRLPNCLVPFVWKSEERHTLTNGDCLLCRVGRTHRVK